MVGERSAPGREAAPDIVQRALAILDDEVRAWLASPSAPGPPDDTTPGSDPVPSRGGDGR